ncbi:DUF1015 family protein [Nocardioides pantholopis]|uniref:DUF1015 family protein n=1 Tax=Nocardioides pantholopis TaxID=2483798 RepID=UPI0013E3BACD|nr:DUF1015 family protein [Nocardioides pantholopis]
MDSRDVVSAPDVAGPLCLHSYRGLTLSARRVGDPASARALGRPYRAVPARVARWTATGDLVRDERPAVYLHEYTAAGMTVRGLVGALDISRRPERPEDRAVLPHEGVHRHQVEQLAARLELMEISQTPILLVHRAPARLRALLAKERERTPDSAFADRAGQQHRIWALRDATTLDAVHHGLADGRALIADGHHRYAAYLRLQRTSPGGPHDRALAMVVDHDDTPLFLGAIHRSLRGVRAGEVVAAATACGAVATTMDRARALAALGPEVLVVTDGDHWTSLRLPTPARAAVEVLHGELLPLLSPAPTIGYHHTVEDALRRTGGERAVAVLVPAPAIGQVIAAATAGRLLPEKATSFQPKPTPGILMRSLRDE